MRYLYLLIAVLFMLCIQIQVNAQNSKPGLITAIYKNATFEEFVQDVEQKTHFKFYYDAAQFEGVTINFDASNEPLEQVLEQVLKGADYSFTIDSGNNVFVLKGQQLVADLPEGIFEKSGTGKPDEQNNQSAENYIAKHIVASQENKVYEIGGRTNQSKSGRAVINGYVRDVQTGEAVIGAAVFIANTSVGAVTDHNGFYSLSLSTGRQTISIKALGFKDARRQAIINANGTFDIVIQPQVNNLKEVVVQAKEASNVRRVEMGVEKLTISTIKKVPTVFGEADVLKVILTLPGVKSVGEASTGFNVRGGAADQNLILFNDATIYNPSHFFGFFSAFNPEVIKETELYKSSIPAKFGGRLSSVLDIKSKEGNKTKFTGSAGIGLLTSRVNVEGPIKKDKTTFILGARTTYSNWLLKLLPDDSGFKNSKAAFSDFNLILNHKLNDKNSLQLTGYWSKDASNLSTDTTFSYSNRNVNLKWKREFNPKLYAEFVAGYDNYTYTNSSTTGSDFDYELKFGIAQSNVKALFNYQPHLKHSIDFGFSSIHYQLQPGTYKPFSSQSLIEPISVQEEQALESAFFIEDKFDVSPKLSINLGLRYSIFNSLGDQKVYTYKPGLPKTEENQTDSLYFGKGEVFNTYHGPEVRLSVRYAVTDNFSVKAGINTQRQYLHMLSNTTAIAPTDIWKLSDYNIKPQYGEQVSLGFYKNLLGNTLELSTEVYYKRIKDYLDYKSGAVLVLNQHIETDVLTTQGKAYGAEFMVRRSEGKFNGWMSYTYSRTLLKANDPSEGQVINKGEYYPANHDKPHDFTFVGNQRLSHRVSISGNLTYSTGRPVTIPIGKYYYAGEPKTLFSERNGYRIPDYFRTDISVNVEGNHKLKQLTHNSWTFGVYNITGRRNPYSIYYKTNFIAGKNQSVMKGYALSIFGSAIPFINYNVRF